MPFGPSYTTHTFQELALFNPVLATKPQVVVLNKIDLPEVRAKMEELTAGLLEHMGHTRLMEISAAARENTQVCKPLLPPSLLACVFLYPPLGAHPPQTLKTDSPSHSHTHRPFSPLLPPPL